MIDGRPNSPLPPYRRPAVWLIGIVALVFGFVYWKLTDIDPTLPAIPRLPPPEPPASRFENTQPSANYVGTQACVTCHADQHESYLQTYHSRSMSAVNAAQEPPGGAVDHPLSHRRFEVIHSGDELRHVERLAAGDETFTLASHTLAYGIGSGRIARSYASVVDEYLVESPLTWYASRKEWGMSPGFDTPTPRSFQRVVNHGCLSCHAGHVELNQQRTERHLQITEAAIGCERCHGPGSLHVERHTTGTTRDAGIDTTIVNPVHLSRELKESICAQCHLIGDVSVLIRGKSLGDYRPGLPLQEYRVDYRLGDPDSEMTVVGHVDQMRQSRCYQKSAALTCTTCHNPHRSIRAEQRIEHYHQVCQNCHAENGCTISEARRIESRQNDCVSCHMPQTSTEVQHVAITQHRIGVYVDTEPQPEPHGTVLTPMEDVSSLSEPDRQRGLGLAYLEWLLSRPGDRTLRSQWPIAERHLFAAYEGGAADAAVLVGLANISVSAGNLSQAKTLCDLALAQDPLGKPQSDLLGGLAWIHMQQRQWEEARRLLVLLVERRRDAIDWYMLGRCSEMLNLMPEALTAYGKSAEIDPSSPETHQRLSELYRVSGNAEMSEHHQQLKRALP